MNKSKHSDQNSGNSSIQNSFISSNENIKNQFLSDKIQRSNDRNQNNMKINQTMIDQIINFKEYNNPNKRYCFKVKRNSLLKTQQNIIENPSKYKKDPSNSLIPLNPEQAIKIYMDCLTVYELTEIHEFDQIYYVGDKIKIQKFEMRNTSHFDNAENDYIINIYDHIYYRYEILSVLGIGSFGQTIKCLDHKTNKLVALKIIKSKPQFTKQGFIEIKLLQFIKRNDKEDKSNIVKIIEHFIFRNHLCIVFELLNINLYEVLYKRKFQVIKIRDYL